MSLDGMLDDEALVAAVDDDLLAILDPAALDQPALAGARRRRTASVIGGASQKEMVAPPALQIAVQGRDAGEADRGRAARPGLLGGEHVDAGHAERDRQIGMVIEKKAVVDVARHRLEGRPEEGVGRARRQAIRPISASMSSVRSMKRARDREHGFGRPVARASASARSVSVISGWRLHRCAQSSTAS